MSLSLADPIKLHIDADDATQKWLEDKIESHSEEKISLESFRTALRRFCESQIKPVIFFIANLIDFVQISQSN